MKIKSILLLTVLPGLLLFFPGCSLDVEDDTTILTGKGPIVTFSISMDSISGIIHSGIGDMVITTDTIQSITIMAQQNIIDAMVYKEEDNYFIWGYKEKVQIADTSEPIIWDIHVVKDLEYIELRGVGIIELKGRNQETLDMVIAGYGNIDAYGLELDECDVDLIGIGNAKVFVNEKLTGLISGQGNVYFKGDPFIQLPITGIGNIINDN